MAQVSSSEITDDLIDELVRQEAQARPGVRMSQRPIWR
jgi:hypothetical protein